MATLVDQDLDEESTRRASFRPFSVLRFHESWHLPGLEIGDIVLQWLLPHWKFSVDGMEGEDIDLIVAPW